MTLKERASALKREIPAVFLALKVLDGTANAGGDYGFAIFNADNQKLIDMFNAGLANIKANGKYDEILAKYLG